MIGVQVHHHQDDVTEIVGLLAVADEPVIIDWVKEKTPVALQCHIFLSDAVHLGGEFF